MTEKQYNKIKGEYDHPDNQDRHTLSYVYRCFLIGDGEEFQLDPEDSYTLEALNKLVDGATEVFQHWYENGNSERGETSEKLLELLEGHIWNPELLKQDEDLWQALVCDYSYQDYMEENYDNIK